MSAWEDACIPPSLESSSQALVGTRFFASSARDWQPKTKLPSTAISPFCSLPYWIYFGKEEKKNSFLIKISIF